MFNKRIFSSKNSFFPKNHNAQIGETITWVIATIVIIVILTLSIFVVSSSPFKKFKKFELNKEADLLATKSITSFLVQESNLNLIKDAARTKDCTVLEERIENFLSTLPKHATKGWNFQLYVNDDIVCEKETYTVFNINKINPVGVKYNYYDTFFKFKENSDEIELRFWEEHQ